MNIGLFFNEALHHTEALLCFREIEYEKKQELQRMEILKNSLEAARKSKAQEICFSPLCHTI